MKRKFLLLILTIITAFCLFAGVAACDNDSGSDVTSSGSSSESSSSDSTSSSGSSSSGSSSSDSTSSGSSSSDSTSSDSTSSGSSSSDSTSSDSSGGGSGDEPTVDPTTYTVTLAVSYSGSGAAGSVAYSTEATDNKYEENATLTITATANTGYEFVGWYTDLTQDAVSANASYEITVTADVTYTALFKATQYNVIFKAGDTTVDTVTYTVEDTTVAEPAVPAKTGYTGAWESYTLTYGADVTVNAVYTANDCTVTYVYNNGSESSTATAKYDGTVTKPADPAKTGSTFNGWYTDEGCTQSYDFTATVTGDITLYAGWTVNTYKVTFDSNGGTEVAAQTIDYNGTATAPEAPTKTGYTFNGWYLNNTAYDFATAVTEDITLTAQWSATTYSITYNSSISATNSNPTSYTTESETITLADLEADGYTFNGWFTSSAFEENSKVTEIVKGSYGDITLYASWTATATETDTVTLELSNSKAGTVTGGGSYAKNTEITISATTNNGYTFTGWYSDNSLVSENASYTFTVAANVTLTATYSINNYTVTFKADGTTVGTQNYTVENTTIEEPTVTEKTGYNGAWESYTLTYGDVTVNAVYTAIEYTITYVSNEVTIDTTNYVLKYTIETETFTLATLTDAGYTFGGWSNGTSIVTEITKGTTGDITLTAQWTINTYTVTFNCNGGTEVTAQTINYNTTATQPTEPTKTGYTFNGWYTDEECSISYDFDTAVTTDITLYAGWTINSYTVTFVNNNDTDNTEKSVEYNSTVTADTITYTGNTFIGWYTDADFTNAYDFDTAVTANITLYAKWEAITYTVTYVYNDGTTEDTTATVAYGNTATQPEDPTYTGYTFLGWYLDGAESAYNFTTMLTEDITLTAKWEVTTCTVTLTVSYSGSGMAGSVAYGTEATDNKYAVNTTLTITATANTGYEFVGWYTDLTQEAVSANASYEITVTADVTYIALFKAVEYNVIFKADGTEVETVTYTVEDRSITAPEVPTKTGYTGAWDSYTLTYGEDVTVNAVYTLITYTVTFVDGDTTVGTDTYTVEDKTITEPAVPTKAGYTSAWAEYELTYGDIEVSVVYTEIEYTVSVYNNNTSKYITESGTITVTGDLANLYSGYTLIGNITIENDTTISSASDIAMYADTDNKLTVYGTFAQTTVTVSGVTYTFGIASTYDDDSKDSTYYSYTYSSYTYTTAVTVSSMGLASGEGYYAITAYDGTCSDNWLIFENSIDGFKVVSIEGEVFSTAQYSGSIPANIVIPENIVYIHGRAFYNNTSVAQVIFLADTVYFNNNNGGSTGSNRYPFAGISGGTITVYFNHIYALGESSSSQYDNDVGFRYTDSSGKEVSHTQTWTYYSTLSITSSCGYTATDIQSDVISVITSNSFTNINDAAYFYAGSVDLTTAIQEAVLEAVNNYTAQTNGYINGYTVTVTASGYVITVTVAANDNAYYKTEVANTLDNSGTFALSEYTNNEDGSAAVTYTDGTNTVKATITNAKVYSYTTTDNGTVTALYVLSGATITVTANVSGVTLNSVTYGGTTATGDQTSGFTFTAGTSGSAITLGWTAVTMSEYTVTVYSDISYSLDGADITKGTQTIDLGTADTTLDGKTVATTESYHYFLGWAYSNEGTLTFTSSITYSDTVTYYAIWGYNANVTLTDYSATSGSTALPTPTPSSGSFYDWYTNSGFTTTASGDSGNRTLTSGVYTYYARMQFTLTVNGTVTTSVYKKTITIYDPTNTTSYTTYNVDVLEGVQIYVFESETSKVYYIYQYVDGENDTILVGEMRIKAQDSWSSSNTTKEVTIYVDDVAQTTFGTSNLFTITADITVLMNY